MEHRSYFVVRGKYKGIEGYYRIDFFNDTDKKYLNFMRNTNYNLRVMINRCGFKSEIYYILGLLNGNTVHVTADVSDACNFITNGSGNFLGFSNLSVVIYGKPSYYTSGFSEAKTHYEYVLTTITNEKTWDADDILHWLKR